VIPTPSSGHMLERNRKIKLVAIALAVLTGTLALTGSPTVGARSLAKASKGAKQVSTIFFSRSFFRGSEFHATSANGRLQRLIRDKHGAAAPREPGWTPVCCGRIFFTDGNRFVSSRLDGSGQRRHRRIPDPNATGELSQRLGLYTFLPLDDPHRIEIMNVKSGKRRTVYVVSPSQESSEPDAVPVPTISFPRISPNGAKVAFTLDRHCPPGLGCLPPELWVVDSDGSNPHPVLNDADGVLDFSFSPQASTIIFNDVYVDGAESQSDLFSIGVNGGDRVQVTDTPGIEEMAPIYSPDANRIVYRDLVKRNLFSINTTGGGRIQLTKPGSRDSVSLWLNARWKKRPSP
jgi:hypothetical protein